MVYRQAPDEVRHAAYPLAARAARDRRGRRGAPDRLHPLRRVPLLHRPGAAAQRCCSRPARRSAARPARAACTRDGRLQVGVQARLRWSSRSWWLDCFELARDIRQVDMRASPYDLSALGVEPIRIETAAGQAEYVRHQRAFADRAAPLRARLVERLRTPQQIRRRTRHGALMSDLDAGPVSSPARRHGEGRRSPRRPGPPRTPRRCCARRRRSPRSVVVVGCLDEHPGHGVGAVALVEDAHLVVDQLELGELGERLADRAGASASSSALTGPLPSPVTTTRSPPARSFTVASDSASAPAPRLGDHPPGLDLEVRRPRALDLLDAAAARTTRRPPRTCSPPPPGP